mmetsp:Transcript_45235/g.72554  ORF Transcript_45235/g.72554 Transcript_45235/m.72554 type:complete len:680 (+) Transcript_45235:153-2192(+)
MIDDIENNISNGDVYQNFTKVLNEKLETSLLELVETHKFDRDEEVQTKSELVVEYAAKGVSSMLKRIPTTVSRVRLLLNRKLPFVLREQLWDMILHNATERESYKNRVTTRRVGTIASSDAEVTDKCQEVFESEFRDHFDASSMVMIGKTVLSYRLAAHGMIEDCYYHVVIPLIRVFSKSYGDIPRVIEALHALLELPRPRFPIKTVDNQQTTRRIKLADRFAEILKEQDSELHQHMYDIVNAIEDRGELDLEANSTNSMLLKLVQKPIEFIFVGILSTETCYFVWDQCLLVGFEKVLVPFVICVLTLLRDLLLAKSTFLSMEQVILHQSKGIKVDTLASEMESRFLDSIRTELGVKLRGMSHWKGDPVPPLGKKSSLLAAKKQNDLMEQKLSGGSPVVEDEDTVKAKLEARMLAINAEREKESKQEVDEKQREDPESPVSPTKTTPTASARSKSSRTPPSSARSKSSKASGSKADEPEDKQEEKEKSPRTPKEDAKSSNGDAEGKEETERNSDAEDDKSSSNEDEESKAPESARELLLPPVDKELHFYADSILRTKHLNPDVDDKEIHEFLLKVHPHFEEYDRDEPVLKVRMKDKIGVFRSLRPGENKTFVKEIVIAELKRLEVELDANVDKLAKHLLKFSITKGNYVLEKSREEVMKSVILATLKGIKELKASKDNI